MTYLTKEDWTNYLVPKFSDDKSFIEVLKQNIKAQNNFIRLISRIISSNSEKQKILTSSMIYYQKYALFINIEQLDLSPQDKLVIYCACIFIALKEANILISIQKLATIFQAYFNKLKPFGIDEIKDLIIQKEFEILYVMEFNMDLDYPYDILYLLKKYLQNKGKGKDAIIHIIKHINYIINDSILFPLCLYYTPNEIVFSCILLAQEKYKLDFININELIKLTKTNIDNENINDCSIYIAKIIKYKDILIENNKTITNNAIINENINNNFIQKDKDNLNLKKVAIIQTNN